MVATVNLSKITVAHLGITIVISKDMLQVTNSYNLELPIVTKGKPSVASNLCIVSMGKNTIAVTNCSFEDISEQVALGKLKRCKIRPKHRYQDNTVKKFVAIKVIIDFLRFVDVVIVAFKYTTAGRLVNTFKLDLGGNTLHYSLRSNQLKALKVVTRIESQQTFPY